MMKNKKHNRIRDRLLMLTGAVAFGNAFTVIPAYAAGQTSDQFVDDVIKAMVKIIANVARWTGVLMVAYGLYMFISGMRNEDIENKHRATMYMMVGVALVFVEALLSGIGLFGFSSGTGAGGGSHTGGSGGGGPIAVWQ